MSSEQWFTRQSGKRWIVTTRPGHSSIAGLEIADCPTQEYADAIVAAHNAESAKTQLTPDVETLRAALAGVTIRTHDGGPCFCYKRAWSESYQPLEHTKACQTARAALARRATVREEA